MLLYYQHGRIEILGVDNPGCRLKQDLLFLVGVVRMQDELLARVYAEVGVVEPVDELPLFVDGPFRKLLTT